LSYLAKGEGALAGCDLKDGDLFRGVSGQFVAGKDTLFVLVNLLP